jgi:hypothetical protein
VVSVPAFFGTAFFGTAFFGTAFFGIRDKAANRENCAPASEESAVALTAGEPGC